MQELPPVNVICVCVSGMDINATENSRSQMWCKVPFLLPDDIQVIWRVAEVRFAHGEPFSVTASAFKEQFNRLLLLHKR